MAHWGLLAATMLWAAPSSDEAIVDARVAVVQGRVEVLSKRAASRSPDRAPPTSGGWRSVRKVRNVRSGDALRTGAKGRAEIAFADGSIVRLGPKTTMTLERADFSPQGQRNVRLRVWLGRLWASVVRRLEGSDSFEVQTRNAVAGVRGTSFAVIAQADLSSVVKVYTGTVGVKKKGASVFQSARVRTSGPEQIDRQQWEEVIATARRQIVVTRIGEIQPAEDFVDAGADQAWANWNRDRDRRR
ncbi:MAG: FecR family protein [Myxococcota bacterium]